MPFDESRPSFDVLEIEPDESLVRGRFCSRHVYYLGVYTGCSCGFTPDDPSEETAAGRTREDLVCCATEALAGDPEASVEIFTCWDDDYLEPAAQRIALRPEDLLDPDRWFDEFVFTTVRAS